MAGINDLFGLQGRTALITCAGGGLGRAIAELFGAAGARLILLDRDDAILEPVPQSSSPGISTGPARASPNSQPAMPRPIGALR